MSVASYIFLQQRDVVDDGKIKIYGNVDIREAQLSFNSSEHIKQLFVQEGEYVIKGQLLATLHTEVFEAQLLRAQAQLFTNQKMLAKLEAGSRIEEINKAKAGYNAATARTKSAIDSYERLKPLITKKLISPDELEKAQALADSAKADKEAVRQALISNEVAGRVYRMTAEGQHYRALQAEPSQVPEVLDALVESETVRVVMTSTTPPEGHSLLPNHNDVSITPVTPHFEDAFVAMLKTKSKLNTQPSLAIKAEVNPDDNVIQVENISRQ